MQRIWALTTYFVRSLFRSLIGAILVIATLAIWLTLFHPGQGTPDVSYYVLVIGIFGAAMAFVVTLTIAARANKAELYPWLVRLPSRVEFMTAVFIGATIITIILQMLLAALALFRGPSLTFIQILEIPPTWISLIILSTVLALHATDLVVSRWSRVYIFGILAILLFAQGIQNVTIRNIVTRLNRIATSQGWAAANEQLADYALTLNNSGSNVVSTVFGLVFWPFRAIVDAAITGYFTPAQALAPAILMLYATILLMLAADLFANKDLAFVE